MSLRAKDPAGIILQSFDANPGSAQSLEPIGGSLRHSAASSCLCPPLRSCRRHGTRRAHTNQVTLFLHFYAAMLRILINAMMLTLCLAAILALITPYISSPFLRASLPFFAPALSAVYFLVDRSQLLNPQLRRASQRLLRSRLVTLSSAGFTLILWSFLLLLPRTAANTTVPAISSVVILSKPPNASVYIDSTFQGVTPITLPLARTPTTIALSHRGYYTHHDIINPATQRHVVVILTPVTPP